MKKALVAYFTCSGVTEAISKTLTSVVDGTLYKIEPEIPYTDADLDWNDAKARSTIEMQDKSSHPTIAGKVADMEQYDTKIPTIFFYKDCGDFIFRGVV